MRVNIAQTTPPSLSPPPSPHNISSFSINKLRLHRSPSAVLATIGSKDQNTLRRSCSARFDSHDFPNHHHHPFEDFTRKQNTHKLNFSNSQTTSFRHLETKVEVLEPSLLGIRPDPPDWPARDAVIRDCHALRDSSIELSLRMIKLKQKFQRLEEERQYKDLEEHMKDDDNNNNSCMNILCCSTLYIIREVQSHALKSRGIVFDEELDDGVLSKVQREMTSSFLWLFKEVFAKTPDLMLQVMVLTSNFATISLQNLKPVPKTQEHLMKDEIFDRNSTNWGVGHLELGTSGVPTKESLENLEESEVSLWKSMVEEANEIGGYVKNEGLRFVVDHDHVEEDDDHDKLKKTEFVSPVGVEIEEDDYEEYYRTDLFYQMNLFQEPNNTLLLSNYAQFLCLVSRDYDRAEECFKRAIQLDPTDAEVMSQYANFLWVVRKDLWGAEERFQQAMSTEPSNSYHASKYANFLWSTGGEDTCYPLEPPQGIS